MKFKELSDNEKKYIKEVYLNKELSWDDRMKVLSNKYNRTERTVRRWLVKLGFKNKVGDETNEVIKKAESKGFDKSKKRFLITSAQNATKIHQNLFNNMEVYAKHIDAEILVIPIRYKNPTSLFSDKDHDWWDDKIIKYLSLQRHKLNNNVTVLSDVKTQPTNANPTRGFEGLAGNGACIIAHPRMHCRSLPTLDDSPKFIFTTGAITLSNYTDSRVGKISQFHHVYGFCIVEIADDNTYFIRQVSAKSDGSFIDLIYDVKDGNVIKNNKIKAIIKGDVHFPFHDEKVFSKSKKLMKYLVPEKIILHDVVDLYSINHHEENNFIKQYEKEINNLNSVNNEIKGLLEWIDKEFHDKSKLVVVNSNHDKFLEKWILGKDSNLKNINPKNLMEYIDYTKLILEGKTKDIGLLGYLVKNKFPELTYLKINESYKLLGWELGTHGDKGVSGTRGSINQYRNLNTHIVTAHTHTPNTLDGEYCVGTNSKLRLGYNNGMSNWVHSDVILHNNKKCQHIFYIGKNKEFTTLF